MIQKVFFDTNIILDIILERKPFSNDIKQLLTLVDEFNLEIHVSALSIADTAYILTKLNRKPHDVITKLLYWTTVIDLNREIIDHTVVSKFSDFEDGLQYFSAANVQGIEAIVTRDKKGFALSQIPVFTPSEFVNYLDVEKR
jgi:predicted nucleic acid-binding protein